MFLIKTDAAADGVKSGFHCYILSLVLCFRRENWNQIQGEEVWVGEGFILFIFTVYRFFYEAFCWCADICLSSMESTLHTHIRAEGFKFRWLLVGRTTDRASGTNTSSVLVFFSFDLVSELQLYAGLTLLVQNSLNWKHTEWEGEPDIDRMGARRFYDGRKQIISRKSYK